MPAATLTFGAVDLEATPGPVSRTAEATIAFGGLSMVATSPAPTAVLYDADHQWVRSMPLANGIQFQTAISDPGMVTVSLPVSDASDVTAGCFLKVFWRGKCRQAARVQTSSIDYSKDGTPWRTWGNQAGVLDMLRDLVVWPEYGIDRTYSEQRTFGYMSATGGIDKIVGWFRSGDWTHPLNSVRYRTDTGFRQGQPAGLAFPNPHWISKRGPYHNEPPGSSQWMRREFTTTDSEISYQILATGDDDLELWLDGEQIVTPDRSQTKVWRQLFQITGKLPAGKHVLAARVRNGRRKSSPIAFICTLQQLKKNGNVVNGPAIINSHQFWNVSDVLPGFRRGDVLRRIVFENQTNDVAAANLINVGFGVNNDTAGNPHADDPDQHAFNVGDNALDVGQQLAEKYIDIVMDPGTLTLNEWNRKGTDLSATVQIARGDQDTGSVTDSQLDLTEPRWNSALMQLADGTWITVEDSTSVATYGRAVQAVSVGTAASQSRAQQVAEGMFRENAELLQAWTVKLTSVAGPQPFRDFDIGDSISVQDASESWVKVRVMGILVNASADGAPKIELEVVVDHSA